MNFSKREIITSSWNILKPNLGILVLVILTIFCLNLFLGIIQDRLLEDLTPQSILFTVAASLFQMGLNLGMLRIYLNLIHNQDGAFPQLIGSFYLLIPYLTASLLVILILLAAAAFFNCNRYRYAAIHRIIWKHVNVYCRINDYYTNCIYFFKAPIL